MLLKVVEAKKLLESGKVQTVQEAADRVGISRGSFYKYKDDIFPFHDNAKGTTITLTFQMDDEPGLLSDVLKTIADFGANILTITQSLPVHGKASIMLTLDIAQMQEPAEHMIETLQEVKGVEKVRLLAVE